MEIQNEIDKLLTLKESFSKIANSYSSLVPTEFVTIQLHAENTDLSAYKIKVVNTTSGNEEFYDISASGYTEFEIKYDSVYEIVFPIIGAYITPTTRTFTAQRPLRKIEASYVMAGVFGLDEQGNRYSLEQIEALDDKSIIKYGGYTDYDLENAQRDDGTYGCGFMWDLNQESLTGTWASANVEFDQELLPFVTTTAQAKKIYDGLHYTNSIKSEGVRLGVSTPAATTCASKKILIGNSYVIGYLMAYGQFDKLRVNLSSFNALYSYIGISAPQLKIGTWIFCHQRSATKVVTSYYGEYGNEGVYHNKTNSGNILVSYPLPK